MANYYWRGSGNQWNSLASWKLNSAGTINATVLPTASDDVFIDSLSGNIVITSTGTIVCRDLNFTGYTGTWSGTSSALNISGSLILSPTATRTYVAGIFFKGTGNHVITSNGVSLDNSINFQAGTTATYTITDNFTVANTVLRNFTLTTGNLVFANGITATIPSFLSSATGVRSVNFNTAKIIVAKNDTSTNPIFTLINGGGNLTVSAVNSTIEFLFNPFYFAAAEIQLQNYQWGSIYVKRISSNVGLTVTNGSSIKTLTLTNVGRLSAPPNRFIFSNNVTVLVNNCYILGEPATRVGIGPDTSIGVNCILTKTDTGGYVYAEHAEIGATNVLPANSVWCAGINSAQSATPGTGWVYNCNRRLPMVGVG